MEFKNAEIDNLEDQLRSAKERLNDILKQKNNNPWEASEWKKEVERLEYKIKIAKEEAYHTDVQDKLQSKAPNSHEYTYVIDRKKEVTSNPALAARYNAQNRLFGMGKLRKALVSMTGQKRKFKELWDSSKTNDRDNQEKIAEELNKMFRR